MNTFQIRSCFAVVAFQPILFSRSYPVSNPGLSSNAFAFASANSYAVFVLALTFDCPVVDAFAFAFDSSAFALALHLHLIQMHLIGIKSE